MGGEQVGGLVYPAGTVSLITFPEAPVVVQEQGAATALEDRRVLDHTHAVVVVAVSHHHPAVWRVGAE